MAHSNKDFAALMASFPLRGLKRKAEAVTSSPEIRVKKDTGERKFHDVDKRILECPVCLEHFTPPVYQCQSGHTVCSACHAKIHQCPSCSQPIRTFIRNLLAERIIESLQVKCPYALHVSKQMLKLTDVEEHRKNLCAYRPCPCPVPGCSRKIYSMTNVSVHLEVEHQVRAYTFQEKGRPPLQSEVKFRMMHSEKFVILKHANQAISAGCMLVHREVVEGLGNIISCTSLEGHSITYDLKVPGISADPSREMNMNYLIQGASASDIRRREDWKRHGFLCSKSGPTQVEPMICFTTPPPLN